jgi:hypothetical protein
MSLNTSAVGSRVVVLRRVARVVVWIVARVDVKLSVSAVVITGHDQRITEVGDVRNARRHVRWPVVWPIALLVLRASPPIVRLVAEAVRGIAAAEIDAHTAVAKTHAVRRDVDVTATVVVLVVNMSGMGAGIIGIRRRGSHDKHSRSDNASQNDVQRFRFHFSSSCF